MAKQDPPAEIHKTAADPRLSELREKFAALQKRVHDLRLVRVEPSEENERKGHVLVTWARTRIAHVVEPPFSIDDSERIVLETALTHLSRS